MRIGVVTVTFNSAEVLEDFLLSLRSQTYSEYRLYVVDNASTDDSVNYLSEYMAPDGVLLQNEQNVGFAAGTNQGIRRALLDGCQAILVINNDITFSPDLLARLADSLIRFNCAMAAPLMYYFKPQDLIWSAGGKLQRWLGFRSVHRGENETDHGQYAAPCRVTFAPLCCVLIRSSVFDQIGLLDERYFAYVEDVDFMYRCLQKNIALWYVPGARLWHKVSSLTGAGSPFSLRFGARNRAYFIAKHLSRVPRLILNVLYPAYYLARFLIGLDSKDTCRIRLTAWAEGKRMINEPSQGRL